MNVKQKIFELFIKQKRLRFSDIEKALGIRSNTLAYHLDALVKEEILEKENDDYVLTHKGESKVPIFAQTIGKEQGVLPVVLSAIIKDGKICLLKRAKRPYKDYWGMIGGKLKLHESVPECALREAKEETGLDCEFSHTASIVHERVREKDNYKHAFILFLCVLKPKHTNVRESDEGKVEWFDLDNLQEDRIIPSDYFLMKDHLKSNSDHHSVVIEEEDERLVKFEKE